MSATDKLHGLLRVGYGRPHRAEVGQEEALDHAAYITNNRSSFRKQLGLHVNRRLETALSSLRLIQCSLSTGLQGMRQMFSAAIFDMDGLLVDSERAIMNTWITVGLDLGVALSAIDYLRIVGRSSTECELILTELLGGAATFREALARVRQHLSKPSVHPMFPLKSGARALLTELSGAGIPCAVASSSPVDEIRSRLGRVSVLQFFKTIAGGDEVDRGKPDPAVYRLAAHRLGVPVDACLAFEDSDNGAHAAASAGIAVVVVPDLKPPTAEVTQLSFRILGTLDVAIEHVADWFTTSDTNFA